MILNKSIAGLEISPAFIRAVELQKGKNKPRFKVAGSIPLPQGAIKDGSIEQPDVVSGAIKRLWTDSGIKTKDVLLGVNNQYVIVRIANMPKSKKDQWDKTIRYQAQEYLPVALTSVELDYMVIEEEVSDNTNQMKVMLVAAGKNMIKEHMNVIESAGLRINDIDVSALALTKMLSSVQKTGTGIVMNLCRDISVLLILSHGIPILVRNLNVNLSQYSNVDVNDFPENRMEELTELVSKDIISSLNYYHNNYPNSNVGSIYLSGMLSDNKNFITHMNDRLEIPTESINPFSVLNADQERIDKLKTPGEYVITTGLAIRGLEGLR